MKAFGSPLSPVALPPLRRREDSLLELRDRLGQRLPDNHLFNPSLYTSVHSSVWLPLNCALKGLP